MINFQMTRLEAQLLSTEIHDLEAGNALTACPRLMELSVLITRALDKEAGYADLPATPAVIE